MRSMLAAYTMNLNTVHCLVYIVHCISTLYSVPFNGIITLYSVIIHEQILFINILLKRGNDFIITDNVIFHIPGKVK